MTCTSISTLTKGAASIPLLPAAPPTTASAWQAVRIALQSALQQIQAAAGVTGVNVIPQQYALFAGATLPPFVSTSNCTPSLDTTNVLFGNGSLKLVLTGSPATIEFAASDAWPLHPNWQWILSLFTMASATLSGTLTITTSSGKTYATAFKPGPETSGLARLADTLNLGADSSSGFGLSFTFTGGTGQTVWLDGLMMEPYFNTVVQPSPFISTSGALTLDNQPDGTTYARPLATALTSGSVDLSKAGVISKTLAYISDATGRFAVINAGGMNAVSSVDTNNRALIDFSQSGHLSKNLDNIGDGTTYARPLATALTSGSVDLSKSGVINKTANNITYTAGGTVDSLRPFQAGANVTQQFATTGENCVVNGGFESNTVGAVNGGDVLVGGVLCDGWSVFADSGSANMQVYWYTGAAYGSGHGLLERAFSGFSIPANSPLGTCYARIFSQQVNVNYGDVLSVGGDMTTNASNSSITVQGRLGVYWLWSDGSETEAVQQANLSGNAAWQPVSFTAPVPAPTTNGSGTTIQVQFARVQCSFFYGNTTSAAVTVPDSNSYAMFDNVWMTRNDVRVAGSGAKIGDQRNLPQGAVNNFSATYSGFTPSYSSTTTNGAGDCTISFPAFTLELTAGGSASYGATSAQITNLSVPSGGASTGPYYFWYVDPTYGGGNLTLNYSTSIAAAQGAGNVFLGAFMAYYPGAGTGTNLYNVGNGGSPDSRTKASPVLQA